MKLDYLLENKLFSTEGTGLPSRDEIELKYKWNLQDIYASDEDWEKDFQYVDSKVPGYDEFRGKLKSSPEMIVKCFKFDEELGIKIEHLYLYAMLAKDSDMKVTKYLAMDDKIHYLYSKVTAASSFIKPELLEMPDADLLKIVENNTELQPYSHLCDDWLRTKKHTLDKEKEELLAMAGEVTSAPYNIFSLFTNADLKFATIKDESGNDVELSHGRYGKALYSKDREYRERAYKNYYKSYIEYINTLTAAFNANLKSHIFYAKARKYNSARGAALDGNGIPVSVYDNLIAAVSSNLAPMYRWAEIKKKLLKLDAIHPYDSYVTLFDVPEKKYEYDESVDLIKKAFTPMGSEYLDKIDSAIKNRWIDVYETKSKRSGAYSSGTTFGKHPYVLLNWNYLLNDVFTLAHEMGHNMHSFYTGNNQPFQYANYSIFVAEVASTFNEALLLDYLIKQSSDKKEKLFLIEKALNEITATFYRQTMFAEFEMKAYEKTEMGEALSSDALRDLYKGTYQKYWGPAMTVDSEEEYTWARVPHFYYNVYVYQYATGYAASSALAYKVLSEGKSAVDDYLNYLKAGSSDYPINILKNAGVDMNSPEPVLAVARKMNVLLDELENLL
jgi:oligoendopeptidase F